MNKWNRRWSASSVKLFNECSFRFWASYIKRSKPDYVDKRWSVLGTAIHETIKIMYETHKFTQQFLLDTYPKVFMEVVRKERVKQNYKLDIVKKQGPTLLRKFYKIASQEKMLKPAVHTEKYFRITYRNIFLSGRIDLILRLEDGTLVVIDFKTSKYEITQKELDEDISLTFYSWACRSKFKLTENALMLFYVRSGHILRTVRKRDNFKALAKKLIGMAKQVDKGIFKPNFNSCKWCDHKTLCREKFGLNNKREFP